MKNKIFALAIAACTAGVCSVDAQYIDLTTGEAVTVTKHHGNGMMYNAAKQRPLFLYVNTQTGDTLYGRTGAVVNGRLHRSYDGKFHVDDGDYIYDNGEYRLLRESDSTGYKRKVRSDGGQKVKYGDYKRKTDEENDLKVKVGEAKLKDYNDGREKVKAGDYRKKIDGDGNFREGDDSLKVKVNEEGEIKIKDKRDDFKGKVKKDKLKEKQGDTKRKFDDGKMKEKKDDD